MPRVGLRGLAPCVVLAAAAAVLRLPFVGSIGPDEGGYAYVASQWARGRDLYRTVWVDRPQGLMLVYRVLVDIAHSAWAIRLGAVAAGVAITLLLVLIGRLVRSPATGLLAGGLYAVVGIGPHIEGYTFNGELAAAVPSTAAVAAALLGYQRRSWRWLAAAGLLGGSALLMKQSGFDGLAVALAVAFVGPATRRERVNRFSVVLGAAAVPLAASALAGWLTGWNFYWSALVGYHLVSMGPVGLLSRVVHLSLSLPPVTRDLLPLVGLAYLGVRRWKSRPTTIRLALVWLVAAFVGVNVGGLYWPHYYIQLLPPLTLLAAVALDRLPSARLAWAAAAVVALPGLAFVASVVRAPDRQGDRLVKYAAGFDNDWRVAAYVRAHSSPSDVVYAFQSRADFYFLANRRAASPYLWSHPLHAIPGAMASLERTLAARSRPRLIVLFQRPSLRAGRKLQGIIRRNYRVVWRAPGTGTPVLAARHPRA